MATKTSKRANTAKVSKQLTTILAAHYRGDTIIAEMAARIDARATKSIAPLMSVSEEEQEMLDHQAALKAAKE